MQSLLVMINNDIPSIYSGGRCFPPGYHHRSYAMFYNLCQEHDFPLHFASPYDFNWEDGSLRGWWQLEDDEFIPWEESFVPEFVFDKAYGADPHCTAVIEQCEAAGVTIFSPPGLARLCNDKWRIYQRFHRYSPLSELLDSNRDTLVEQIFAFFDKMDRTYAEHDNRVVVKPLHGFQSRGIHIISRTPHGLEMHMLFGGQIHGVDIERNLDTMVSIPYLIQAWVDTSAGIPGIGLTGDRHDVRFIFGIMQPKVAKFIQLYVKTKQGMRYFPLEKFEASDPFRIVNPIAERIARHFPYGIFSVDVMHDASGVWFLTELNDQTGLTANFDNPEDVEGMVYFQQVYIEELKRVYYQSRS